MRSMSTGAFTLTVMKIVLLLVLGGVCLGVNGGIFDTMRKGMKAFGVRIGSNGDADEDLNDDADAYEFEFSDDQEQDHEAFKRQASNEFRQRALSMHNELRARHGSPPLSLDDSLNREAQAYAEQEAQTNVMKHSCGPCNDYGENLAYSAGTGPAMKDGPAAEWSCQKWYDEVSLYNFQNPNLGESGKWGHFTALIWKSTTKFGIGVAYGTKTSASGMKMNTMYVVARYTPPGNLLVADEMKNNVGSPRF